jgi:hypothetical protein
MLIKREDCFCRGCGKSYQQLQVEHRERHLAGKYPEKDEFGNMVMFNPNYDFAFQVCDYEGRQQIDLCGPCLFKLYEQLILMVKGRPEGIFGGFK